jgi:hypothetical protein
LIVLANPFKLRINLINAIIVLAAEIATARAGSEARSRRLTA